MNRKDTFENIYNRYAKIIYDISQATLREIKNAYDEEEIDLPIDIKKIADKNNIAVQEADLSTPPRIPTNRILGALDKKADGQYIIYYEDSVDSFTQRYAIAHEIGRYLIEKNVKENSDKKGDKKTEEKSLEEDQGDNIITLPKHYSIPLLSNTSGLYNADVYAIFLLMPLNNFFEEFSKFVQGESTNIDEWIRDLSEKAQMPNYNLAFGYDYIRAAAYEHYIELSKCSLAEQMEKYVYLFI